MWKPKSVGAVIAERTFVATGSIARGSGRNKARVSVRFGQPVLEQGASKHDPWWCPVEVKGAGLDSFQSIAGVDSLQALILALEFVTRVLPQEAEKKGLRIEWLGDAERLVLARHVLSRDAEGALYQLLNILRDLAGILSSDRATERKAFEAVRALVNAGLPGPKAESRPRSQTTKRRQR